VTASVQHPSDLPAELQPAFLPLHKRALGMAFGITLGGLVFLVTAVQVLVRPDPEFPLYLLGEYFYGYTVSWEGAFLGLGWGFVTGFVAGWFLAFARNFGLAAFLFITRTRADLAATNDFLDHI
jgi:hypothetical protein